MAHKSGPRDVASSAKGESPSGGVPGGPGRSFAQKPFAGPEHPGQPIAMKKALAKKGSRSGTTGYAGNLKPNPRA
jgi:hypothetical protein